MQLFRAYLWQRRRVFAFAALCCVLFFTTFALYRLPLAAVSYPTMLCALAGGVVLAIDFARVRRRHRLLTALHKRTAATLDALPSADSIEAADYQTLIALLCDQTAALETAAAARYRDMIDYYTAWAHQIKTPIASMRLTLQNEDSPLTRRLTADLFRIEQYVEMVMAFLRLDAPGTDYVFRSQLLDAILRGAVRKFAPAFIDRRIRLDYTPVGLHVVTDEKWLSFVIEQLLSNALKYTPDGGCVRLWLEAPHTLCIGDDGIGIAAEDLPRVFEKGYTGLNGRRDKQASGLGLYLCKRVCDGLGIGIDIRSSPGRGTTVLLDLEQYELKKD